MGVFDIMSGGIKENKWGYRVKQMGVSKKLSGGTKEVKWEYLMLGTLNGGISVRNI